MIIWITGAPGAGKTTVAKKFQRLFPSAIMLDGDAVRKWLTPDCDFSKEGRLRHAERVLIFARGCTDAIVSVVSHPPGPVDLLVLVEGPKRKELWPGTSYNPPDHPDLMVRT